MSWNKKKHRSALGRSVLSSSSSSSSKNRRNKNDALTLSNGTEVFEVQETFSVNSLIEMSFHGNRKVLRGRHQELFNRLDKCIQYEHINYETAKLSYIGGTFRGSDADLNHPHSNHNNTTDASTRANTNANTSTNTGTDAHARSLLLLSSATSSNTTTSASTSASRSTSATNFYLKPLKTLPSSEITVNDAYHEKLFANMKQKYSELPLQKHDRIHAELTAFTRDLQAYLQVLQSEDDRKSNDNTNANDDTEEAAANNKQPPQSNDNQNDAFNVRLLLAGIERMQAELAITRNEKRYEFVFEEEFHPLSNVSSCLIKSIQNMSSSEYSSCLQNNQLLRKHGGRAESEHKQAEDENKDENEVKNDNQWFIYQQKNTAKTLGTADAQFLDVEKRISDMENCMGFVADMKNPFPDLLTAIAFLEGRYAYTFGVIWKDVKKYAERMSKDLKGIKNHLDLLQARTYKQNEKQIRQQWEQLEILSRMMFKWDPSVFDLILIVQRLTTLQNYHYRSCLFINRVNEIYKQQCIIYESLKTDELTLNQCLASMARNKKLLTKNVAYVKQRLNMLDLRSRPK